MPRTKPLHTIDITIHQNASYETPSYDRYQSLRIQDASRIMHFVVLCKHFRSIRNDKSFGYPYQNCNHATDIPVLQSFSEHPFLYALSQAQKDLCIFSFLLIRAQSLYILFLFLFFVSPDTRAVAIYLFLFPPTPVQLFWHERRCISHIHVCIATRADMPVTFAYALQHVRICQSHSRMRCNTCGYASFFY